MILQRSRVVQIGCALTLLLSVVGCDRPFVPVHAPDIELVSPDESVVQGDERITVRLRATSFRAVSLVTLDGADMRAIGNDLFELEVGLTRGTNDFIVTAFDEEAVPGVDTLRFFRQSATVVRGPVWPSAVGAMTVTPMPDGTVLVIGGAPADTARAVDLIQRFDPQTGTATTVGHLVHARAGHTATVLPDGRILVAGGSGRGMPTAIADMVQPPEIVDPVTFTSREVALRGDPVRRAGHTAGLRDRGTGLLLDLTGGWGDVEYRPESRFGVRQDLRAFRVEGDSLVAIHPAPGPYVEPLAGHTQTALTALAPGQPGRWLVTGAAIVDGIVEPRTLILDTAHPAGIDVENLPDPTPARNGHAALLDARGFVVLLDGFVVNDRDDNGTYGPLTPGIALFLPAFRKFLSYPDDSVRSMSARHALGATNLPDGRILLLGGFTASGTVEPSIEYLSLD